ncbi:MAG: hypothetical protein LBU35_00370 [Holosporales bacterium]|jgi:hypothetical protein|nr:hypothetical protein [Holosporales bacterium]
MRLKIIIYAVSIISILFSNGYSMEDMKVEEVDVSPFAIVETYTNATNDVLDPQIVNGKLDIILRKYPFLAEGFDSISKFYDEEGIPTGNYDFRPHKWLRNLVFIGQLSVFAANEVVKCLSIYSPVEKSYGDILIGLGVGKAAIWSLNSYFDRQDAEIAKRILLNFSVSYEPNDINADIDKATESISAFANIIIERMKHMELEQPDSQALRRLEKLKSEISSSKWSKRIGIYGGKVLTTLSEITSGFLVHFLGQTSLEAYWSTLTSSALGSFFDDAEKYFDKKTAMQKYMLTSETLYLCKYFSEKLCGSPGP